MTRARDALAAERRRMPWLAVEKEYEFDGPKGKASLPGLLDTTLVFVSRAPPRLPGKPGQSRARHQRGRVAAAGP